MQIGGAQHRACAVVDNVAMYCCSGAQHSPLLTQTDWTDSITWTFALGDNNEQTYQSTVICLGISNIDEV